MATDVQIDWDRLIDEWKSLAHGEGKSWFKQKSRLYFPEKEKPDAFRALFYREKRERIGKSKESPKPTDRRKLEICKIVVEMKERGKQRSDFPREMPTADCLKRLVDRGHMKEGELSPSHANHIMREKLGYREETPRHRWEVPYALAEIQTDGSVSKYYRPWKQSDDGNDILLKASGRPLAYKGRDANHTKLILWQFQDKYSRLRTVRGFPGKAESTAIMLAHMSFWLNREEDEHMMRHIGWGFAHDNGSLFGTDEWENLMKAFEIEPDPVEGERNSMPYEKTGIGSVERMWQPVWTKELIMSEDYPTIWLSEYNFLMHEYMIEDQQKEHPYYSGYRGDLYQQSLLKQERSPRVLKQDVYALAMKRFERKVRTELNISIDGEKYRVPQYWEGRSTLGEWVVAWKNWRGELVAELRDHHCEQWFELEPFEHRMKGDFSGSHQRTYQQKMKDLIASGDSLYDEVMNGKMSINGDGEYVDEETGEVLSSGEPKRLMPKDDELQPDSPFAGDGREAGDGRPEFFESVYAARVWIGKQLQGYGLTYEDVSGYFDPKLEHEFELDKGLIGEAVNELIEEINLKSKTG